MATKVFPTKVDGWLVGVLAVTFGAVGFALVWAGVSEGDVWPVVIWVLSMGFVVGLSWPTQYVFGTDELTIRSGLFRWRVAYRDIEDVSPTRSILSAPAWSLDRLAIRYGKGRVVMVSPQEKAQFERELRSRMDSARRV